VRFSFVREAAGAASTRHSLRPLSFWANVLQNSDASRRGNAGLYLKLCPSLRGEKRRSNPKPSFRGDAKHRTRNLEIPRCASAHLRSGANAPSRNDGFSISGKFSYFTRKRLLQQYLPKPEISPVRRARSRAEDTLCRLAAP